MRFEYVSLPLAVGLVLADNVIVEGRRVLRKGVCIGERERGRLELAGVQRVTVARFDPTDIGEEVAALRVAVAAASPESGVVARSQGGGRVSLRARHAGVWRVDVRRLQRVNTSQQVTLATLSPGAVVASQQLVATLKVIPLAVPESLLARVEAEASGGLLSVGRFHPRKVSLLVFGDATRRRALLRGYGQALGDRLGRWGVSSLETVYVSLRGRGEAMLAQAIEQALGRGAEMLLLAGETATMDIDDLAPRAVHLAGGRVEAVGAPVFPGNLLLLARVGGAAVVGLPGCVRGPERNVVDLVLPRLLAGERLGAGDIAALGSGGLLAQNPPSQTRGWGGASARRGLETRRDEGG